MHADALINGERKNACSQQFRRSGLALGNGRIQPFLIKTGVGTHAFRRGEVRDQKVHWAVPLGLQGQLAGKFQRSANESRQNGRFGQ
ncbi:hypothetical protein D3C87_1909850 [compost metagenome]